MAGLGGGQQVEQRGFLVGFKHPEVGSLAETPFPYTPLRGSIGVLYSVKLSHAEEIIVIHQKSGVYRAYS